MLIDQQWLVQLDSVFFFQAEDGIRDLVRSRGLGDVYKRQPITRPAALRSGFGSHLRQRERWFWKHIHGMG